MSMQNSLSFPEDLKYLPLSSGVYIMKDKDEKVLYVGKAKSLRKRVVSYTRPRDPKTRALSERIKEVEFVITSSDEEAMLLENNLIKKHWPPFNVRLVDDENYPYIKITDEKYPRILKVYRVRGEKGEYFGPFPHGSAVDSTVKAIRKIFPIRSCNIKISAEKEITPCLLYHIGLCSAPCEHKISQKDYMKMVNALKLFLKGEGASVVEKLRREMENAKNNLDFERAIIYRDELNGILSILEKQRVVTNKNISFDAIAVEVESPYSCIVRVSVRNGRVVSTYPFVMEIPGEITKKELLEKFLFLYPFHAQSGKVYVSDVSVNRKALENFLTDSNNRVVKIIKAKGKVQKEVLSLARENATAHLKNYIERHIELKEKKLLEEVQKTLGLSQLPVRIEGYDISNISGTDSVGSMVVFTNGKPDRKEYRHFKIKYTKGPDDFAMLEEVLTRRFSEGEGFSSAFPNLILIDGGKGQLEVALKIKKFYNILVDVISIAKKEELIFVEGRKDFLRLKEDSPVLQLVQRVRDESHRFAKSYFEKLHLKRIVGGKQ